MGQILTHLDNPTWQAELKRLQAAGGGDRARWQRLRARKSGERSDSPDSLIRMGEFFLAVSTEEGRLLYLLTRAARARYVVEFGASYGVSTLFLAARGKSRASTETGEGSSRSRNARQSTALPGENG